MRLWLKLKDRNNIENIIIVILRIAVVAFIIWFMWAQSHFVVNRQYEYASLNLPKSLVGFKIAHISDISNTNNKFINKVKKSNPDIILISGGYMDSSSNFKNSATTVTKLSQIAPTYYIYNSTDTAGVLDNTSAINVTDAYEDVLNNCIGLDDFISSNYGDKIIKQANNGNEEAQEYIEYLKLELENTKDANLRILGIGSYDYENGQYDAQDKAIELMSTNDNTVNIILNANKNNLSTLTRTNADIIMFGNTYGVIDDTFKYSKGVYGDNGTQLFVSGGAGNKKGVRRILNFPEIQTITLTDGTVEHLNPLERFIGMFWSDVGTIFDNDDGFKTYKQEFSSKDK